MLIKGLLNMNGKKIIIIVAFLIILSIGDLTTVSIVEVTPINNYQTNTANQCSTPTVTINVANIAGQVSYNVTKIVVPKNTCVQIVFNNPDPSIAHTFTINNDSANDVSLFNIYDNPSTTGMSNFMTPNLDISLTYYCAIPGHYASGEEGTLVVGSGTPVTTSTISFGNPYLNFISTLDFPIIAAFMGIVFIVILRIRSKKVN